MPSPPDWIREGRPARVAVIGAGYFAQFHLDAWARLDGAEVFALVERDAAKAEAAAKAFRIPKTFASVPELLADCDAETSIDLFDIVTPPETHFELVTLATAHEIPAICQKPLAPDAAGAATVVEIAEAAGIPLIVHENFRFQPWYREIKRLIDTGALGAIRTVTFRFRPGDGAGPDAYLKRQPYFRRMTRFLIHETGVHFIDVFRFLLGEPRALTASLRRINPVITGEDAGYVIFEFHGGVTALFDANRLNDHAAQDCRLTMGEMIVEGADAVLRLNGDGRLFIRLSGRAEQEHLYSWNNRGFGGDCVFALCSAALKALETGITPENTGRAYLRNVDLVDAIYDSSRTGRRVTVELDALE